MTSHIHLLNRAIGVATLLVCASGPASSAPVGSTDPNIFGGPVLPLPKGCKFVSWNLGSYIPDGVPRSRPYIQTVNPNAAPAFSAQVIPYTLPKLGYRSVAFTYNFANTDLMIPQRSGAFFVSSVRATVHMGPTTSFPVASDRARADSIASIAWAGSATEGPVSWGSSFQKSWMVRVQTRGSWQNSFKDPIYPAEVTFECVMEVKPAATPVLQ